MIPVGITIHCSDSPQGRGDDINAIRRWHKERGFKDVGYHYVILENGTIQQGRTEDTLGAHAKGHNNTIGICLIGIDSFTDEQFKALTGLCLELKTKYKFKNDVIKGHCELDKGKTCPNFDVKKFKKENL